MEKRADIFSCRNNSETQVEVNLTDSKIQSHSEMLHFATVMQARQQMIERIQLEMTTVPDYHAKSFDQLQELTKPIIGNMRTIRPSLRKRFTATTFWQLTIIIEVILIMISNLLEFAGGYLRNRYEKPDKLTHFFIGKKEIQCKPVIVLFDGDKQLSRVQSEMELMRHNYVLSERELRQNLSSRAPSYDKFTTSPMNSLCKQIALQLQIN